MLMVRLKGKPVTLGGGYERYLLFPVRSITGEGIPNTLVSGLAALWDVGLYSSRITLLTCDSCSGSYFF